MAKPRHILTELRCPLLAVPELRYAVSMARLEGVQTFKGGLSEIALPGRVFCMQAVRPHRPEGAHVKVSCHLRQLGLDVQRVLLGVILDGNELGHTGSSM